MYRLLKQLIKLALFFFFKKIVISGKDNLLHKGPLIIVANHPNTLMDPLIIASLMKQQIGFLGNAGLFSNSFLGGILTYFNVIPVFRKKDVKSGMKPDNKHSFSKCYEYLNKKGTILIFPEGNSYYELKLREIKTGTARIALSYEALKNFDANLKILPISLDYSDAIQFRSMVSVTIGEPISVENYKQAYLKNERTTISSLTDTIQTALEKNIPNTENEEQEQFLLKAHKFYATFNNPESDLQSNPKESLVARAQISKSLNVLQKINIELYKCTESKVHLFFSEVKREKLTSKFFTDKFLLKNKYLVCLNYFFKFLFLTPIYLFGLLFNYIPYILASTLFKISKLDVEYKTSVQMLVSIFTFPLFYFLQVKLIGYYFNVNFWNASLLVITFLVAGYIAMYYWVEAKRFKRVLYFYFFLKQDNKRSILKLRDEILINIEIAKASLK